MRGSLFLLYLLAAERHPSKVEVMGTLRRPFFDFLLAKSSFGCVVELNFFFLLKCLQWRLPFWPKRLAGFLYLFLFNLFFIFFFFFSFIFSFSFSFSFSFNYSFSFNFSLFFLVVVFVVLCEGNKKTTRRPIPDLGFWEKDKAVSEG